MREEANQAVDDKCRVCLRAPAYNDSIYPNIAGFQCDACLDAEIKAADPDYKDAIESETEMPVSVALEFSLKATALQQSTMAEHNAKHCKIPEKSRKVEELYVPNDEAHPGDEAHPKRRAAKADRHKPPGPNMGIQGFAFPTVTPTYNGARYRWLMQGWDSEFLANP
jgi:hypothetical protein